MHARYKDYVSGGLRLKNLRDPDGGVHLVRKKVLMGIADEINPAIIFFQRMATMTISVIYLM